MTTATRTENILRLNKIECRYQQHIAVHELNLDVSTGELCCLMGPSGCGKTTILRAIAGLEPLHKGEILFKQKLISSTHTHVVPEKRNIGMVFQEYALFPHLNIDDNIGFSLRRMISAQRNREIRSLMTMTQLDLSLSTRYPHELSGGQQQRVALARALAARPPLLLMDEPFSNLDVQMRRELNLALKKFLIQENMTAILVTHNQEEGFAFSDHMGILNKGRLQQWDSTYRLYHLPSNRFVAKFVGQGSFIPGQVATNQWIDTEIGHFPLDQKTSYHGKCGDIVDVLIRPDDILFAKDSALQFVIHEKVFSGDRILYTLKLPSGNTLQSLMPSHLDFEIGMRIGIATDLEHLIVFPGRGNANV